MKNFYLGGMMVAPGSNRVIRNAETIKVEPKSMDLLVFMVKQSGEPITKSDIMKNVWPETVVTDDSITRCISQLRKIFHDECKPYSVIETVAKKGYQIIAPVTFHSQTLPGRRLKSFAMSLTVSFKPIIGGVISASIAFFAVFASGRSWTFDLAIILASFFIGSLVISSIFTPKSTTVNGH